MKRLLLLSVCIAFFAASCSKKAVVPNLGLKDTVTVKDTISATVDGVNETFNSVDTVRFYSATSMYISGTNATNSDKIIFIFPELSGNVIGTYDSAAASNNAIQMLYGLGPGYTANNYYYNYHVPNGPAYDGSVTITTFTNTTVKGTFSGTLIQESSASVGHGPTKTITNGKFTLAIK
ncbi:MAG TPA: hypothetical protein VK671_14435 [Mucilaginibacter sp.]|jgi:hypothetical protein|nr:hypothetical protein [Mucilaginibacter sp.]